MQQINDLYELARMRPSDINEHIPTLMRLGRMVDRITEFGTRKGVSTVAFLAARPQRLTTYDIVRHSQVGVLEAVAASEGIDFSFVLANVLSTAIRETDLLFIDTLHTHDQIRRELDLHGERVRKFLVFHDTTTFGEQGETPGTEGIWRAISEYCLSHRDWRMIDRWTNNNGLAVFMRQGMREYC
jgi:hypothetical protein